MTPWQKRLRFSVGVFGLVLAVVVFLAIQKRTPPPPPVTAARLDPKASVESGKGRFQNTKAGKEVFEVLFDHSLNYASGVTKLMGVTVNVDDRGGRSFVITGTEAEVGPDQSSVTIAGNVKLAVSDGLTANTDQASYARGEGIVRAPGKVTFARDRMSGSGVGMTYDKARDVLWLLDQAEITVKPDEHGRDSLDVHAGAAGLARADKYMKFERGVKLTRDGKIIESDEATAYLTDDEKHLKSLELHGNSRITPERGGPGSVQQMNASEMNLAYGPDGEVLQHATLAGQSVIQLAGEKNARGSRIAADALDVGLSPDGASLISLVARENVQTDFAADRGAPARAVKSKSLDGKGEEGKGLTAATFTDNVEFRETIPGKPPVVRTVRARLLEAILNPATVGLEEGKFSGAVHFEENDQSADAAIMRYSVKDNTVDLSGVEGTRRPTVADDQIRIEARAIQMKPESDQMVAINDVRSTMQPARKKSDAPPPRPGAAAAETHMPGMLEQDQPVSITGDRLEYDGSKSIAVYAGNARLWQGDTTINADTLNLNNEKGDLTATGNVRTTWNSDDAEPAPAKPAAAKPPAAPPASGAAAEAKGKSTTTATAADMHYEDALRRATYTGAAHLVGVQGDLLGAKIELYMQKESNAVDRVEAYDAVTVKVDKRTSVGSRLTYFAAEEKYVMSGSPVKLSDECSESTGKVVTFYKSTDTILIDGRESKRPETKKNGAKCQ